MLVFCNIKLFPSLPWAVLAMAIYLWLFWRYLQGEWWPPSTAHWRRQSLRAASLSPQVWRWSLWAGGLSLASLVALVLFARHLVSFPHERSAHVAAYPFFSMLCLAIMSAVVAGVVEESAFRGYMQVPLEKYYGPLIAIVVATTIFGCVHFSHGFSLARFLSAAGFGAVYAILAWRTGSIRPGVLLHVSLDAFEFCVRSRVHLPMPQALPIALSDPSLWVNLVEAVVLAAAGIAAFAKLRAVVEASPKLNLS